MSLSDALTDLRAADQRLTEEIKVREARIPPDSIDQETALARKRIEYLTALTINLRDLIDELEMVDVEKITVMQNGCAVDYAVERRDDDGVITIRPL